jgi:hypothetical protein
LLDRDRRILSLVAGMPFVRMVALSGSLAHLNAEGSADLDLFVITAPHRVWSVTVATLVLSKMLGWRKHVCMNYVVSEHAMSIAPCDLFSATRLFIFARSSAATFTRSRGEPIREEFYPNTDPKPASPLSASPSSSAFSRWVTRRWREARARAYGWHLRRRAARWQSRDQVRLEQECEAPHQQPPRVDAAAIRRCDGRRASSLRSSRNQRRARRTRQQ